MISRPVEKLAENDGDEIEEPKSDRQNDRQPRKGDAPARRPVVQVRKRRGFALGPPLPPAKIFRLLGFLFLFLHGFSFKFYFYSRGAHRPWRYHWQMLMSQVQFRILLQQVRKKISSPLSREPDGIKMDFLRYK
jgi:hypothetical protein